MRTTAITLAALSLAACQSGSTTASCKPCHADPECTVSTERCRADVCVPEGFDPARCPGGTGAGSTSGGASGSSTSGGGSSGSGGSSASSGSSGAGGSSSTTGTIGGACPNYALSQQLSIAGNSDPQWLSVGDIDQDSFDDLVVTNRGRTTDGGYGTVWTYFSDGGNGFQVSWPDIGSSTLRAGVIADINQDGKPDLLTSIQLGPTDAELLLLLQTAGRAPPTFVQGGDYSADIRFMIAGPLSGAGSLDAFFTTTDTDSTQRFALYRDGGGSAAVDLGGSAPGGIPLLADLDGDGKLDLAVATPAALDVRLNAGDGSLATLTSYGDVPSLTGLAAGDFNEDGRMDVAVVDSVSGNLTVLLGQGSGVLAVGSSVHVGRAPGRMAVADFNQDGHLDLAIPDAESGTLQLFQGDGAGHFAHAQTGFVGSGPVMAVRGDFNHDGADDFAVANAGDDTVSVLYGRCR